MNALVNKATGIATMTFNLKDENDRTVFISWLKQLQPVQPADQFEIDKCILVAGGEPDHEEKGQ